MKTNTLTFLVFLAVCSLSHAASAKEEDDYVGTKVAGIHDSNGRDVLSPGFFIYFAPLYFDVEFGPDVWQMRVGENLDGKDFKINFDVRARKEDIGGGLIFEVPVKKTHAIRFGANAVGREEEMYAVAVLGGDYSYDTHEKFSFDIVQESGRKQGTMIILRNHQNKNNWRFVSSASLTRFGDCGFSLRGEYKDVFMEFFHVDNFDYNDYDRTSLGFGYKFNF